MTIPENFRDTEHLQDTIRKTHNRIVKEFFRDAKDDDIKTPRGSLKRACLIQDDDSMLITLQRYLFYHFTVRKGEEISEPIYGIPIGNFNEQRKYRPQIKLFFEENKGDVDPQYRPLRAEISKRLMSETATSLNKIELEKIAKAIKREFCQNNPYYFKKGKVLVTYKDLEKGYDFQLYVWSKTTGVEIIKKVLEIFDDRYEASLTNVSENEAATDAYPTLPPRQTILKEKHATPRKRPVGTVYFRYATCSVWGRKRPIELVDASGRLKQPIIRT